jgi:beta-phosphoglucomutase-like phosphatase (HAD superfamily)
MSLPTPSVIPPAGAPVEALIFDMDGTMIDSMPWHAKSWVHFTEKHGIDIEVTDLLARTTGRTGIECMRELFQREMSDAECAALVHEKEDIYRALFGDIFVEVAGFKAFANAAVARGLKVAVGTAGDKHNIEFAMSRLKMDPLPLAIVGGDEGLTGKPTPAIFLEAARRIGVDPARCIVFEDAPFGIAAARRGGMRAVAVCSSHSAAELAGPHVIATVRDYNELIQSKFLETLQ